MITLRMNPRINSITLEKESKKPKNSLKMIKEFKLKRDEMQITWDDVAEEQYKAYKKEISKKRAQNSVSNKPNKEKKVHFMANLASIFHITKNNLKANTPTNQKFTLKEYREVNKSVISIVC